MPNTCSETGHMLFTRTFSMLSTRENNRLFDAAPERAKCGEGGGGQGGGSPIHTYKTDSSQQHGGHGGHCDETSAAALMCVKSLPFYGQWTSLQAQKCCTAPFCLLTSPTFHPQLLG